MEGVYCSVCWMRVPGESLLLYAIIGLGVKLSSLEHIPKVTRLHAKFVSGPVSHDVVGVSPCHTRRPSKSQKLPLCVGLLSRV